MVFTVSDMKLLNVRLGEDDARKVARLREAGVQISRLVREAIRAEHDRRLGRREAPRHPAEIMAEIYAAYPDPPGLPARRVDLRDRKAVRRAVLAWMRRRRA